MVFVGFSVEFFTDLGVSKNSGTSKSSILIGFSIINHPFWGTTIFGNTHLVLIRSLVFVVCGYKACVVSMQNQIMGRMGRCCPVSTGYVGFLGGRSKVKVG